MATAAKSTTSTDKAAPAPFVMPKVALVTDYEPTPRAGGPGRVAAPNPFTETVQSLAATWDDEKKRSLAGAKLTFDSGDRLRVTAKFGKAANAAGFSPSYDDKADEKGKSVVVAYLVPKITRNRKGTEEATATA